ncbi:hypothetical protein JW756_00190 [Candidatus Woesearchaeota archaeon]|nr:hypothetical protein [Candidatus Woesearchaeota archaeon]
MAYELTKEATVPRKGAIFYVAAPFDDEMKLFEKEGLKLISAKELAHARMKLGKENSVSQNGSWIREGGLYVPERLAGKASIVLLRDSLVLENPESAVAAHRKGKEASIDDDKAISVLEEAKKDSKNYHILESTQAIPTNGFGENSTADFLFGKHAKDYGLFLKDARIGAVPLYFDGNDRINSQGPYVSQLWLGRLGSDSIIFGDCRSLKGSSRARGVQLAAEGGRAEKTVAGAYSPSNKEVERNLRITQEVMKGTRPAKDLEKIVVLLEKFRKN